MTQSANRLDTLIHNLGVRHPKIELHTQHTQVLTNSTHNTGSHEKFSRTRLCALFVELDSEKFSRTRLDTFSRHSYSQFRGTTPRSPTPRTTHTHTRAHTQTHTQFIQPPPDTLIHNLGVRHPKIQLHPKWLLRTPIHIHHLGKKNSSKFRWSSRIITDERFLGFCIGFFFYFFSNSAYFKGGNA